MNGTPGYEMGDAADFWREQALRDAAVAGDPDAWHALYDTAYDRLAGYVHWRTAGLADLADEVIQETWLTAARRLRSFDPAKGPFAAWVAGIAANVVRNQIRAWRRRPGPLSGDEAARIAPDPREQAERVAAALAALPERSERVLRAKYLDGETVDAIARASGESPKAVESLLTRARQAFREAYSRGEQP
jgi:RNA polymerase sigma-70 factor (ECF subfamily)